MGDNPGGGYRTNKIREKELGILIRGFTPAPLKQRKRETN